MSLMKKAPGARKKAKKPHVQRLSWLTNRNAEFALMVVWTLECDLELQKRIGNY